MGSKASAYGTWGSFEIQVANGHHNPDAFSIVFVGMFVNRSIKMVFHNVEADETRDITACTHFLRWGYDVSVARILTLFLHLHPQTFSVY